MKTLKSLLFIGTALCCTYLQTVAQDKTKGDVAKDQPVTVTGCLAQDAGSSQFVLKSGESMPYPLEPAPQLNLKAHLGHKVTIAGTPMKGEGAHDDNRIRVTSLTMVSTTCP